MANTTFSGPVISKNGFITTGPGMTVSLTADTTLTVATHAGKIYHTVYKNYRFVKDLSGPTNAVFSKKEFIDAIQSGFQRYTPRKS